MSNTETLAVVNSYPLHVVSNVEVRLVAPSSKLELPEYGINVAVYKHTRSTLLAESISDIYKLVFEDVRVCRAMCMCANAKPAVKEWIESLGGDYLDYTSPDFKHYHQRRDDMMLESHIAIVFDRDNEAAETIEALREAGIGYVHVDYV